MKTKVKDNVASSPLFLAAVLAVLMSLASSASAVVTIDASNLVTEWTNSRSYICTVLVSSPIGGGDQFDWSLVEAFPGDNIPSGLDINGVGLNKRFGELSGTPGGTGTFHFRIKVIQTHAPEDSGFIDVSLVINPTPSFSANLPNWSYGGIDYDFTMPTPVGGTPGYKWYMRDQPTSLSIDSMTGIISGTIQAGEVRPQAYFVIVTLKDTTGAQFEAGDSVHIYAQPVITTPSPLPAWTATHPYSQQLATNRQDSETLTFSLAWGSLPSGLTLSSGGLISGVTASTGQAQCSVKVQDPKNSMRTQRFTLTINPILQITTTDLKDWSRSTPLSIEYIDTLSTTGGTRGVKTWNASGTLPPGLSIVKVNASQAVLRGQPSLAGTYNFGLSATDSVDFTSQTTFYPVTINPSLTITTAGASLPEAIVGDGAYSFTVTASGGTGQRDWKDSLNTLSSVGLRINNTTGVITANPNVIGPGRTASVIVRVIDGGGGKAIDTFSLKVDAKPTLADRTDTICEGDALALIQGLDENAGDGAQLSYTLRTGFNVLPGGISLQSNGQFSGTAAFTSAGIYGVQVIVCDPAPNVQCDTASFVIVVRNKDRAPAFKDTITNNTQAVYEGESLYRLRADDADNDPLSYTLIGGSLPPGVGSVALNGTFPNPTTYVPGDTSDRPYDPIFRVCDTVQQQCIGANTSLCATKTLHIVVKPDRVPPHVTWGPVLKSPDTVCVGIDDFGIGVEASSARIRYRLGNAKAADTGWLRILTQGLADSFKVVLPGDSITSTGLEVRVQVSDLKGNAGDTGWISVPVQFASGSETQTRDEWLGANDSLWHLVSFPGSFSGNNRSVRTILETLSGLPRANGAKEDEWRLYRFLGTQSNQDLWDTLTSEDQSNEVRIGEGYWFRHMMKDFTLTLPAFATASSAAPFPIPLQSGWNLIGNPFFFPLTIHRNSLQQANANSLSDARPADPGDAMAEWQRLLLDDMTAADTAVLEPFKGYAIYCERISGDTLYLDPHYQSPPPAPAGPEIWSLPITAFVDNATIGRIAIGVIDAPSEIARSYDSRSLGMFTRTSAILIADSVRGKFVRQVLPRSSDVQKWILAMVPSETGGMSLAWGSQQPPEPGQKVLLRDVLYDRVVDMAVQPVYSVTNAAQMPAGRLVIYLGDSAAVMRAVSEPIRAIPNGYRLYQNYPNPFNPTTTLAFDLPVSSHVELVIFNILGERVRTLVSEVRSAGSYVIPWNSRDDGKQSVASGVYFARLLAGARAVTIKMALVK